MTIKIIDDTTVEVDGVIGVFKHGGGCYTCIVKSKDIQACLASQCFRADRDGNYVLKTEE